MSRPKSQVGAEKGDILAGTTRSARLPSTLLATLNVRLLRRFLRRLGRGLRAVSEMVVRHLEIVLGSNGLTIADPGANYVQGERLG